jgi:hypothetical protein
MITSGVKVFARVLFSVIVLTASLASVAFGQSTDVAWPSPVRSNEVRGTIPARDIGDPRVTDHFYAFTGTPGDVLITVDSRNLNGDIDVFTFSSLRPLLKFTVYAGSYSPTTKSIYLRQQQDLILRVEGRTPNDDDAVYRLRFGGAFEPITSGPLAEHEDAAAAETVTAASGRGGKRVSSVGARIEEPPAEVAAAPTPEPTPEPKPEAAEAEPKPPAPKVAPRSTRSRRPPARRTRPGAPKSAEETTAANAEKKPDAAETETETAAAPKPATRRTKTPRAPTKSTAPSETEETGPRLLIDTADGTLVDRSMGSVRRVTVENGQVVVVWRDGRIQRIPLTSVVRMTIAP